MPLQRGRTLRLNIKAQVTAFYRAIWQTLHFMSGRLEFLLSAPVTEVISGDSEIEQQEAHGGVVPKDVQGITTKIGKFGERCLILEK